MHRNGIRSTASIGWWATSAGLLLTVGLAGLTPVVAGDPAVWPGFRGDGRSVATAPDLPLEWSPQKNIAWRQSLPGYGQSTPVVWNDRLFVTAVEGPNKEKIHVVAVAVGDGRILWHKSFAPAQPGPNHTMMSRAASSPVVDAQGVYCLFETGDLLALTHDGQLRWHRKLTEEYGPFQNNHGLASSLAQDERAVFVLVDHAGPSYLLAVDKRSGKNLWKADRPSRISWTSPVVTQALGRSVVIACSGTLLTAYDAQNGQELARYEGLVGVNIPSPTAAGGLIAVAAGLDRTKPDAAGSARSNCLVRLQEKEGRIELKLVWPGQKVISGMAAPVIHQGHVYYVSREGMVYCIDLNSGEVRYNERLDDEQWATPIAAGDRIYFFGRKGITTVLKSGPEYDKLAVNRLWTLEEYNARLAEAKKRAVLPPPRKEGGPPAPKGNVSAAAYTAVGDIVYGVAAVPGAFLIRTGTELIAVGQPTGNR